MYLRLLFCVFEVFFFFSSADMDEEQYLLFVQPGLKANLCLHYSIRMKNRELGFPGSLCEHVNTEKFFFYKIQYLICFAIIVFAFTNTFVYNYNYIIILFRQ